MKNFITIGLATIILTGCFEDEAIEVNDINCQHQKILEIKDKEVQQEFSSKCLRRNQTRSGEFKSSPEKSW